MRPACAQSPWPSLPCGSAAPPPRRRASCGAADLTAPPADATKSATGLISQRAARRARAPRSRRPPTSSPCTTPAGPSDGRMFDSSIARGNPSMFPLSRVMAGLARVRAADGHRRDSGAAGCRRTWPTRARPGGPPARWCSTSSCWTRASRRRFRRPTSPKPPKDAKRTRQRPRLQGAAARAPACATPTGCASDRALHGLDDRRQDVRQLGPARHADARCSLDDVIRGLEAKACS